MSAGVIACCLAELQSAAGAKSNEIPIELWETQSVEQRDGEERAITPAPGTVVGLSPTDAA